MLLHLMLHFATSTLFLTVSPGIITGLLEKGYCDPETSQVPAQCITGTSFKLHYSELIENHGIIGPVLKTLNARDDNECKDACFMNAPDECYMLNYYSQSKKCELFYKDRLSSYKVVKRNGSAFKTRKCKTSPCQNGGQCYSLGDVSHEACVCKQGFDGNNCQINNQKNLTAKEIPTTAGTTPPKHTTVATATNAAAEAGTTAGTTAPAAIITTDAATTAAQETTPAAPTTPAGNVWVKVSTSKVCFGTRDNSYRGFTVTKNGRIQTFKLVYVSGAGLKAETFGGYGKWGAGTGAFLTYTKIETHITDVSNKRITPPTSYTVDNTWLRLGYDVLGYNYNSDQLVFPNISSTISVQSGDEFRIWYGADLQNGHELDNSGQTCADVHAFYSEIAAPSVWVKVSTSKVCFGTRDNSYGGFTVTKNGRIQTFKLVYVSGAGLKAETFGGYGKWGAGTGAFLTYTKIETHITDVSNKRITPPIGYPVDDAWGRLGYDVLGYNYNSDQLVLPNIPPALSVKSGDQFRIWYGADLQNQHEDDNSGQTCADVYAFYSEIAG